MSNLINVPIVRGSPKTLEVFTVYLLTLPLPWPKFPYSILDMFSLSLIISTETTTDKYYLAEEPYLTSMLWFSQWTEKFPVKQKVLEILIMKEMWVRRRRRMASGHLWLTPGICSSIPSNLPCKIILIKDSDAEDKQVQQQDPFRQRSGAKYTFGLYLFYLMDHLISVCHSLRRYLIPAIAFQYPPQYSYWRLPNRSYIYL